MTREEKANLLNELLEYEENNDIGNLTRAERREFQQWINEALEQEPQTFEWCTDCREYDQKKHCCPRYNKVIRSAVEEIKQPKTHWISYWGEEARCYVYKCPECGNKQPFDTKHCWECGARLDVPDINDGKLSEIPIGSESEE